MPKQLRQVPILQYILFLERDGVSSFSFVKRRVRIPMAGGSYLISLDSLNAYLAGSLSELFRANNLWAKPPFASRIASEASWREEWGSWWILGFCLFVCSTTSTFGL